MIIKLRSNSLVGWLYNITNRFVPCIHKYIYPEVRIYWDLDMFFIHKSVLIIIPAMSRREVVKNPAAGTRLDGLESPELLEHDLGKGHNISLT